MGPLDDPAIVEARLSDFDESIAPNLFKAGRTGDSADGQRREGPSSAIRIGNSQ